MQSPWRIRPCTVEGKACQEADATRWRVEDEHGETLNTFKTPGEAVNYVERTAGPSEGEVFG